MYKIFILYWNVNSQKGDFLIAMKHALTIEEVVKGIKMRHYNIELFLCMGRCDYIICQTGFPFFSSMKEKAAIYEIWSQQHIGILISGILWIQMDKKCTFIHFCGITLKCAIEQRKAIEPKNVITILQKLRFVNSWPMEYRMQ